MGRRWHRVCALASWALAACAAPGDTGDTTGETTAVVASFGEDGPQTTMATTDDTSTGTSSTASTGATLTDPVTSEPATSEPATSEPATSEPGDSSNPTDTSAGSDDSTSGGMPPVCATLEATVRDFTVDHVDMALPGGAAILPGLVLPVLGADGNPVFNAMYVGPVGITSADSFAQWYADVAMVNIPFVVELEVFEESPGRAVFDDAAFYPIDDLGFGNEGQLNNSYFTTAVHTALVYQGGEVMSFGGDDDVWVFIDGLLVADVGGQHAALFVDVALDALGLVPGESYALDIFHAERGIGGSRLRFELGGFCPMDP